MKKKSVGFLSAIFIILAVTFVTSGCASAPAGNQIEKIALTVNPGEDESIVIIQRKKTGAGSMIPMRIWIDDADAASGIKNGNQIQLIVPNGEHKIQAGSSPVDKGNVINFTADGEAILFFAEPKMGLLAARFDLNQVGKRKL